VAVADALVLLHFIGASSYSADWAAMVRRILGELGRRLGIQQEVPDKPDALRLAFANALSMAAARLAQPPREGVVGAGPRARPALDGGQAQGPAPTAHGPRPTSRPQAPPRQAPRRIILVLDGLNQLEDRDQAPDLVWLPPETAPNVRLLSTLPVFYSN
jgi:hypothetical protein